MSSEAVVQIERAGFAVIPHILDAEEVCEVSRQLEFLGTAAFFSSFRAKRISYMRCNSVSVNSTGIRNAGSEVYSTLLRSRVMAAFSISA